MLENQSVLPVVPRSSSSPASLGAPIFALLGGIRAVRVAHPRQPAGRAADDGVSGADDVDRHCRDSAVHAGGIPARRRDDRRSGCCASSARGSVGRPAEPPWPPPTLCAFFTLFTGGSGVTILVLGGLLLPALLGDGYRERFSIGLLTASGSLGLLFPLSLPLMLYGIVSQKASIEDLFIGGLLPGLLMLGLLATLGVREGLGHACASGGRSGSRKRWPRCGKRNGSCSCPCSSLVRSSAASPRWSKSAPLAALYTLIVQRYIHRDLPTWKDVLRVAADCVALVGGVLVILAVAAGLTDYLVYAEIPTKLVDWTQAHIHSRLVFLLGLNVFLLLVGTLMDIFSAIVVVVPLILPLAEVYGIDYVHLGIIFVANLELGFLHPPLGLNLLLASVRFKKPVLEVTWATLPMLGILAVGVLLITYVPWLTLGLLHWLGRGQ